MFNVSFNLIGVKNINEGVKIFKCGINLLFHDKIQNGILTGIYRFIPLVQSNKVDIPLPVQSNLTQIEVFSHTFPSTLHYQILSNNSVQIQLRLNHSTLNIFNTTNINIEASFSYILIFTSNFSSQSQFLLGSYETGTNQLIIKYQDQFNKPGIFFSGISQIYNCITTNNQSTTTFKARAIQSVTYQNIEYPSFHLNYKVTNCQFYKVFAMIFFNNNNDSLCDIGFYRQLNTTISQTHFKCKHCPKGCLKCHQYLHSTNTQYAETYLRTEQYYSNNNNNWLLECTACQNNYKLNGSICSLQLQLFRQIKTKWISYSNQFQLLFLKQTSDIGFLLRVSQQFPYSSQTLGQNLQIYMVQYKKKVNFTVNQFRQNVFRINISQNDRLHCIPKCQLQFKLFSIAQQSSSYNGNGQIQMNKIQQNPPQILKSNVIVFSAYSSNSTLPPQLNTALSLINNLASFASASGFSSMVRILLELQQIIQIHKYLCSASIVMFSQLQFALRSFKFMDLTIFLPQKVSQQLLSYDSILSSMGPINSVYYDYGADFIKNMISPLLSVFAIWIMSIFIWAIFAIIPIQFCKKLAYRFKKRAICVFHDSIQTLLIPITAYWSFSSTVHDNSTYYRISFIIKNVLMCCILVMPISIVVYIKHQLMLHPNDKIKRQCYVDLMRDCKLQNKQSVPYYLYSVYKKIAIALVITQSCDLMIQLSVLIFLNLVHVIILTIIYINGSIQSKLKFIFRFCTTLSILLIEIIITIYNFMEINQQEQIDMGQALFAITIMGTLCSICQFIVTVIQFILQAINDSHSNNIAEIQQSKSQFSNSADHNTSILHLQTITSSDSGSSDQKTSQSDQYSTKNKNSFAKTNLKDQLSIIFEEIDQRQSSQLNQQIKQSNISNNQTNIYTNHIQKQKQQLTLSIVYNLTHSSKNCNNQYQQQQISTTQLQYKPNSIHKSISTNTSSIQTIIVTPQQSKI